MIDYYPGLVTEEHQLPLHLSFCKILINWQCDNSVSYSSYMKQFRQCRDWKDIGHWREENRSPLAGLPHSLPSLEQYPAHSREDNKVWTDDWEKRQKQQWTNEKINGIWSQTDLSLVPNLSTYLTSLSLSFFICKIENLTATSQGCSEDEMRWNR